VKNATDTVCRQAGLHRAIINGDLAAMINTTKSTVKQKNSALNEELSTAPKKQVEAVKK
jgi:hypothetical protein